MLSKKMIGILRLFGIFLLILNHGNGQEDSLRTALNAIDRRQEEYPLQVKYDDSEYGFPMDRPEDLVFLKSPNDFNAEYQDNFDQDDMKKRISSSFRERVEEDKQKQIEELARTYLSNLENEDEFETPNEENYDDLLQESWEKYRRYPTQLYNPSVYAVGEKSKRYYYPQFGIGESTGLRKRSRYFEPEKKSTFYPMSYPEDETMNRLQEPNEEDYYNIPINYNKIKNNMYGYSQYKRFPVTKRSSDYSQTKQKPKLKDQLKKETDPKVAKELSDVFGVKKTEVKSTPKPKNNKKEHIHNKTKEDKNAKKEVKSSKVDNTKEVVSLPANNEKPLQVKKKSIDWSDYFGLDRRKKSEKPNNLDREWLIERYHKAISMASKRNAEHSAKSFRNPEESEKKSENLQSKDKMLIEEQKINDMDSKLKSMEDTIITDTLKYTGAHEGTTDSKKIQEIKDKVISRLAAAYSLEKMRNALGEYKLSMAKEKERLKQKNKQQQEEFVFQEEKRTSVPRKQAVDERLKEKDQNNQINCAQENSRDCLTDNFGTATDILEQHFGLDQCPIVERNCNGFDSLLGRNGNSFEKACNMYQMCLICTSNNDLTPVGHCNMLFLAKAKELCLPEDNCAMLSRSTLRFLNGIHRYIQSDLKPEEECEQHCPNMESLNGLFDMR